MEGFSAQEIDDSWAAMCRIARDPSRGDRLAVVWTSKLESIWRLYFDAEWRRDTGYPNLEVGFPVDIPGLGQSPPAMVDVDEDPFGEIVFATMDGNVHVVNHDGTAVPGWPIDVGAVPIDGPVAVGDLDDDGSKEIVAGTADGWVHVFQPDGTPTAGWPVNLGTGADTYVSIGSVGRTSLRHVVATSGNTMHILRYDGASAGGWPASFSATFDRPAAIGDVDEDGRVEIVTLKEDWFHVHDIASVVPEHFRQFSGETFSDAPTLADFDGDGDLEIAAPTVAGRMHLLAHDGADHSASWPFDAPGGTALTSASLAQFLGDSEIEMTFAERGGKVHVVALDGTEHPAYPKDVAAGLFMPPTLDVIDRLSANVTIGAGTDAWSWHNTGAVPPGWPKALGSSVDETPASGDIDLDGRNEVAIVGLDRLFLFDVGVAPETDGRRRWPMYGHDPQRTGCLDCPDGIVVGVEESPAVTRISLAPPHPNPVTGSAVFRYALPAAAEVTLRVFDVRGRLVREIASGAREPGRHAATWNGTNTAGRLVANGHYVARLEVSDGAGSSREVTRKLVLLR